MNNDISFGLMDAPTHAPLMVTYTDGHKETISNVRYKVGADDADPVVIESGGTVRIETFAGRVITLLGVRQMEFVR